MLAHAVAIQAQQRKMLYKKKLQVNDGALSFIEMQREALERARNTAVRASAAAKAAKAAVKAAHLHL